MIRPFLVWAITALSALVGFQYELVLRVPITLAGAALGTLIPYSLVRYSISKRISS